MSELDQLLTGAADAAPTWRSFTADAMDAVSRRAVRRQRTERVLSVTCALFAVVLATTTVVALRPDSDSGARTVSTADDPALPSVDQNVGVEVDTGVTTTTSKGRPSVAVDGRDPAGAHPRAKVTASSPPTAPPLATPTTGPTPSTTAPTVTDSRAPAAFAALNGAEVETLVGPNCWRPGGGREVCAERPQYWYADAPLLEGIQSGSLRFRWAIHEQPIEVTVTRYFAKPDAPPETEECKGGNPCRIDFAVVDVGSDPYWYVIETQWEHGTVSHAVKVHPVE